jgi:hypothetical protein
VSGGRDFDPERFEALVGYVHAKQPWRTADDLAHLMFHLDFDAYRKLGTSLTGASYLRGAHKPEVAELDPNWYRRWWRAHTPLWAQLASVPLIFYVIAKALRQGSGAERSEG